MPSYFFDTSALVKLYHNEEGSERVEDMFNERDSMALISEMGAVEMHSALAKKVRTKEINEEQMNHALQSFYGDYVDGRIEVVAMDYAHYTDAVILILQYSTQSRLRTLDAIQLAVSMRLHQRGALTHFVCADQVLCDVGEMVGLQVINPTLS